MIASVVLIFRANVAFVFAPRIVVAKIHRQTSFDI